VDLNVQHRPHWLEAPPALTMKFSLDVPIDDDPVGQAFALHLNGDFSPRHKAGIIKVERRWQ
jgi:hypothetical protein